MGKSAAMERERIREEAARWVVRLSDSPGAVERAEFEAWRASSIEHEIAFEREASAWERLDRLSALGPPQAKLDPDLLSPASGDGLHRGALRRWAAVAASLLLVVGAGSAAVLWVAASPAYATGVGERRLVVLSDGSTVELNTDSRMVVRYGRGRRRIQLMRGEAMFHIAPDQRPFLVQTAAAQLDAKPGDVSVRLTGDGARVTVKAGAVVAETAAPLSAPIRLASLGPSSEVLIGPQGGKVHAVSTDEMDRTLAWRQGAIALRGQTLAEAVAEFNRYNARKIVVADPVTGAIRVGGYFQTSDVDGFVRAVGKTFPVEASRDADGRIVLSRGG